MKKLSPGDWVVCRFYNTPEGKFYGETFTALIIDIVGGKYLVKVNNREIWLHRKEIKRRIVKLVK